MRLPASLLRAALALTVAHAAAPARAQHQGFQLGRHSPTAPGEWSFAVDHPWYSRTRHLAAGLTLNYAHSPLVLLRDGERLPVIEHQLHNHLDLAGSLFDRVTLSASLPLLLAERGVPQPQFGLAPAAGAAIGDPRLGLMVRLFGQPDDSPVSLHLGAQLWVPLRKFADSLPQQASDREVRLLPRLVAAGLARRIRWSASFGFLYRADALLGAAGDAPGRAAGPEIQIGGLVQYADRGRRLAVGPEALLATLVTGGAAFTPDGTSLELLLGGHYNLARQVQLGLALGTGLLRQPGTPDARLLLRVAYAPERRREPRRAAVDSDGDGVLDEEDRCPGEPEDRDGYQDRDGCPDPDNDGDGVLDRDDRCPLRRGPRDNRGCPDNDRDGDGLLDRNDRCPEEPEDRDDWDDEDGCPDPDNDGDGVLDGQDRCATEAGVKENQGCPDRDRDRDGTVDRTDLCPTEPGPPPQGCPERRYIIMRPGKIELRRQIHFATNKAKIFSDSFDLLNEVADALRLQPELHVRIEGHTDSRGKAPRNLSLSQQRAAAVREYLIKAGIQPDRLIARGFGSTAPIADNRTAAGREKNRRTDFVLLHKEQMAEERTRAAEVVPAQKAQKPKKEKRERGKKRGKRERKRR